MGKVLAFVVLLVLIYGGVLLFSAAQPFAPTATPLDKVAVLFVSVVVVVVALFVLFVLALASINFQQTEGTAMEGGQTIYHVKQTTLGQGATRGAYTPQQLYSGHGGRYNPNQLGDGS